MEKRLLLGFSAAGLTLIGLTYLLFPADFINDLIPVLGLLDDIIINLITFGGTVANIAGIIYLSKNPEMAEACVDGYYGYGDYYEE